MISLNTLEETERFIDATGIVLLYISRPDCGVCKALIPKIKDMLSGFPGINSGYLDLEAIPEAAGRFSVFTIPGILIFIQGKESIRKARYVSVDELSGEIERYYSMLYR